MYIVGNLVSWRRLGHGSGVYSGGQEGYVKGSKEKGGGIGIKVTLLKLKRIIRNRLKIVLKLKSVCGKKRQVKHGKWNLILIIVIS